MQRSHEHEARKAWKGTSVKRGRFSTNGDVAVATRNRIVRSLTGVLGGRDEGLWWLNCIGPRRGPAAACEWRSRPLRAPVKLLGAESPQLGQSEASSSRLSELLLVFAAGPLQESLLRCSQKSKQEHHHTARGHHL
jgi:hypothetical protein